MRWTKAILAGRLRVLLLAVIAVLCAFATALAHWTQEKRLAVFTGQATFSVAISQRGSNDYVSLNEVLQNLGSVDAWTDGNKLKLRFNSLQSDFENGEAAAEIDGKRVNMPDKAFVENGSALIPLGAVAALLPHFLNTSVSYHAASQRLFLGDAGIRFALELKKGDVTQLVLTFSTPVSPQISTEPGRLTMVFARDPLLMKTQRWQFDDTVITSAEYHDGAEPELRISSTEPLLATFEDGGRTIFVTSAPAASQAPSSTVPDAPSVTAEPATGPAPTRPAAVTPAVPAVPTALPRDQYLVVIDASHGGAERGAALSPKLAEKDVTLAVARSLRKQLAERGLSSLMVRDADNALTPDQRAVLANTSQAAVYVAVHAGASERGVRVYTSMLTRADAAPGPLVPWEKAQAGFVRSSRLVGTSILEELGKSHVRVPPALLPAPVRPLNNIAAAAVAIEIGPLSNDMESVSNTDYQEVVAKALASALVAVRPRVERAQ